MLQDFDERGFAAAHGLAPPGEIATFAGLFEPGEAGGSTLVRPVEPALLQPSHTLARARELVGSAAPGPWRLEFAQWYCKPAGAPGATIPWHQDRAFWSADRGFTLTTWIALDDASAENGCLRVSPGSHEPGEIRPHAPDPASSIPTCALAPGDRDVAVEIAAGDGVLYHERLVHRSGGNATDRPRRALVLGWTAV